LQDSDNKLQTHLASNTALQLEKQQIPGTTVTIYCEHICRETSAVHSSPLWLQVFQPVHDVAPGTKATARLVAQRFM
jgi:hypothetical protein